MEENFKQKPTEIIKIALVGPESTGKTTLASQLAATFNTTWIPEFARDYLQEKWDSKQEICSQDDLIPIAIGQINLENESLSSANKLLFCDTNVLVTKVFSDIYYGTCHPIIERSAQKHDYDLIFLTDVDVPWQPDDLRDKPTERETTLAVFEKALNDYKKPYIKISGNQEKRIIEATKIINDLLKAKNLGFNSNDFYEIYNRKINIDNVEFQLSMLRSGVPKLNLDRAAIKNDGIISISEDEAKYFSNFFDEKKTNLKLKKFVPASGAASRMFKFLNEFLNEYNQENESINAYINRKKDKNLSVFLVAKEKLPFYKEVLEVTKSIYPNYNLLEKDNKDFEFIKTMLSPKNFNFANKPKGILPFHQYVDHTATAIEEHLKECVFYATSNHKTHLHFTISEEHQNSFEEIINKIKPKLEISSNINIEVKYSFQNKSTDVIAFDLEGKPFRDEEGTIVFRPGGHGALIENLNNLNADIVFIKNIDNVIQNHVEIISLYKKALAGILIRYQETIFRFMKLLNSENISYEDLNEIVNYIKSKLNITLKYDFEKYTKESKIDHLKTILNRPIRVCGMVKNEGEPGGGPFWVIDKKGKTFLQIIESSQIDIKDKNQIKIFESATHFNPVDLVCGMKDYKGQKFDLTQFIDKNSGFIVEKNNKGKSLRAFELPGLWNGAMAKWLTIFVEIPLITFNPVKTVNDLLKSAHQSLD